MRLSPRVVTALLWCALALLPLRVLAAGWMQASMALSSSPATAAPAPPCHAATADEGAGTSAASQAGCTLCDLCHAGAPALALPSRATIEFTSAQPPAPPDAGAGRPGPDGLFRPPRSSLAA